jgi:predicted nucleic acid-binding protein
MIVADTSALISVAIADCLDVMLDEFEVHTTDTVWQELSETAAYDDTHGHAARRVLERNDQLTVHTLDDTEPTTSRIDAGEGSCAVLTTQQRADFLITDDFRALPELQQLVDARVVISPLVLKALVTRGVLDRDDAVTRLEQLAADRDWLGAPIYRHAKALFDDT